VFQGSKGKSRDTFFLSFLLIARKVKLVVKTVSGVGDWLVKGAFKKSKNGMLSCWQLGTIATWDTVDTLVVIMG
jgi:hypothetical protein